MPQPWHGIGRFWAQIPHQHAGVWHESVAMPWGSSAPAPKVLVKRSCWGAGGGTRTLNH